MITVRQVSAAEMSDLISSELEGIVGDMGRKILIDSCHSASHIWLCTDTASGRILCFYGLTPPTMLSIQAHLWMWTAENIRDFTVALIRHSQRHIHEMLQHYPKIFGFGHTARPRSLAWLRRLGAQFGPVDGQLIPFTIKADS